MTGSSNDRRNISASMSGAPSLVNSLNSFSSNSKLSISPSQVKSPIPEPTFVERSLEKAKFYTSLCLGEFQFQLFLFVFTHYVFYVVVHFLFILRFSYHRKIVSSFFFFKSNRNVSHIICVCIFILNTVCGGSGDNDNFSGFSTSASHLYRCRSHNWPRNAELQLVIMS